MKKKLSLVALGILSIFGLLFAVSCATSSPDTGTQTNSPNGESLGMDSTPGANVAVIIEDLAFSPATITIDVGTAVTWTNRDSVNHTVTSRTEIFDSGIMPRGSTFSYTFTNVGDFEYYCTLHPNMVGHIIVK